jgi:NAD(P)-dependent dehydrogenase (short-subunit alcohol dehydrogenase family)
VTDLAGKTAIVADAVVFLAGPGARNITGVGLPVTAGR